MEEDSIFCGPGPDPGECVSLQDVFEASYRPLVVQLYGITGSYDEAEDVVQEAFARAAATGHRFLHADNHEAWLRTTATNVHRSRWRKLRNGRRARDRMSLLRDPEALADHLEVIDALRAREEIERRGWSRRRHHQAGIGAVAASVLAATGFVATQGRETRPPAEDVERHSSATPYPAHAMVTLHAGTYELTTSPDGLRPAVRFTLTAGWNAGTLPERFEGLSDRVTYNGEVNTRLVEADPDWSLRMLLSDVQWVAQRGCSDVEVTDAASLVQALTHVPGLRVISSPVSAVRLNHPAVHLRLREQGSQSGPCWRRSILRSGAHGYLMHDEPGTVYDVWVVDADDRPVLVGGTWTRRTPGTEIDSLQGVLDTIGLLEPS